MAIKNRDHQDLKPVAPIIEQPHDYESISDAVGSVILSRPQPIGWYVMVGIGMFFTSILGLSVAYLFAHGTGVWAVNIPVAWGFAIVNFVWWIGIGHAGTLISAILLLLRQEWRNAINRFAEAMTIFAVACAGMYPLLHLGRPWVAFFILPYPNTMGLWPQFRSPLLWDVFAISTYASVSILFWYIGLVPDFAMLRDRAKNIWVKRIYGAVALGWRGSARHWHRYEMASLLLAGLCTPLVVSVHSIVSFDFAIGIVIDVGAGFLVAPAPSAEADHFVEFRPVRPAVVRSVDDIEPAAFFHVCLEAGLGLFRPIGCAVSEVADHDVVFCEIRGEIRIGFGLVGAFGFAGSGKG